MLILAVYVSPVTTYATLWYRGTNKSVVRRINSIISHMRNIKAIWEQNRVLLWSPQRDCCFFCFGKNENSSSAAGRSLMTTGNKSPGTNSLSCSRMCHFFFLHVFIFFPGKVKRLKKATDGIDILCKWVLCSQKTSLSLKVWLEFHKITDILKSNITDASVAAVASVTPS